MAQFGIEDVTQDIVETPQQEEIKTTEFEAPEQQDVAPLKVEETNKITQDPPSKKLWEALSSDEYGNLYTKSFDEFKTQFSSPEKIDKLYSTLSSPDYEFYTKSPEDFKNQFFPELKKKDLGGLTLQGGGLEFGTPTPQPTQDELTKNIIESSNVFDLVKGSETNPDFQKVVVDKKIDRDQINEVDRLLTETPVSKTFWSGEYDDNGNFIPDINKTKKDLSEDYINNKEKFNKQYNGLKLANSLYNGFASHLNPDDAEQKTYEILNQYFNVSKQLVTTPEGQQSVEIISPSIPTLQKRAKETYQNLVNNLDFNNIENKNEILNNFRNFVGSAYGEMSLTGQKGDAYTGDYLYTAPENKILSEPQLIAWKYLQDTNPEAANTYKAAFIKDEDVKNYSTQLQKQKALRDLQIIGANLSLPEIYKNINQELSNVNNAKEEINKISTGQKNDIYANDEEKAQDIEAYKNEIAKSLDNLSKLDGVSNRYQGYLEGAKTNPDYAEANKQDADILSQELLDSPTSSGLFGLKYPLGRLGTAFLNTATGIADFIKTPFLSDYEKTVNAAQNLGLNSQIEKNLYVTQRDRGMSGINNYMKPEFEAEFNKIKDNPNLSADQKRQQVSQLIINNPGAVTTDYSGQEKNTTLNSMYYSLVDMAADIVPYLLIEAASGGGATPALASRAAKFKNAFIAAFLTSFEQNLQDAYSRGVANPYEEAVRSTVVGSTGMGFVGSADILKNLLGKSKNPIGKYLNNLTDKELAQSTTKVAPAMQAFQKTWNVTKGIAGAVPQSAIAGTELTAVNQLTSAINNSLNGQDPKSFDEYVDDSKLEVLKNTLFGVLVGGTMKGIESLTPTTKLALLDAGERNQQYLDLIKKKLELNDITSDQAQELKNNVEKIGKIYNSLPFVDANGKKLDDVSKRELMTLKFKENSIQEQLKKDNPEKLANTLNGELQDVKIKVNKIYDGNYEWPTNQVLSESVKEDVKPGYQIRNKNGETGTVEAVNEDGSLVVSNIEGRTENMLWQPTNIDITSIGENKAAETPVETPKIGKLTEQEYIEFLDNGVVSQERLNDIAEKIKNKEQLSDKEKVISMNNSEAIDKIISEKPEVPTEVTTTEITPTEVTTTTEKAPTPSTEISKKVYEYDGKKYEVTDTGITDLETGDLKPIEFKDEVVSKGKLIEQAPTPSVEAKPTEVTTTTEVAPTPSVEAKKGFDYKEDYYSPKKDKEASYRFTNDEGQDFDVSFTNIDKKSGTAVLDFQGDYSWETMQNKNPFKTLSTVGNIVKEVLGRLKNDGIDIETFIYDATDKKGKIYENIIKKEYPNAEFKKNNRGATEVKLNKEAEIVPSVKATKVEPVKEKITINKDVQPEFTTSNGRQKVKRVGDKIVVTDAKTGKEVSRQTYNKAIKEYVANFDFTHGEEAGSEKTDLNDATKDILENSNNPEQIASIYAQTEMISPTSSTIESMIADYGIGKTSIESFRRHGDINRISQKIRRNYIGKKGELGVHPLDATAKEISEHYFPNGDGTEITPTDLIDFMEKFESKKDIVDKMNPLSQLAIERFKELTGLNLNNELADNIINQRIEKFNQEEKNLLKEDYESEQQLTDAYWKAYEETNGFTKEAAPTEIKQPSAEVKPAKQPSAPAKELTPLEKAKEARKLAKEKLNSMRKNLGIAKDPKEEAKALFEYHKALVAEAKEYIKEGITTIKEFAKQVGEKIDDSLKAAWNEAKGLVKAAEKPEDVEHIADFLSSGENLEEWTGITKAKMSEIDVVRKMYEKETNTKWTNIQQEGLEAVQKKYPRKTLYDAVRTRVQELAAKYDAKEDYNPTAKDIAVIQEFKRQTRRRLDDLGKYHDSGINSENSIEREVALQEVSDYENDLLLAGKALFTREAGTAFGFRASESSLDENSGLQIRKAQLIRANDGDLLSKEDTRFVEDNWAKQKDIMKREREIAEQGLKDFFEKKIEELTQQYEQKLREKKPQLPAETRKKTLSQKGKDVANIIRTLKMPGAKVDFTLGTWNLAVEGIAKLVEGGATIAEAIDKLIKDKIIGFKSENDKVRFEDDFAAMIDNRSKREKSFERIKEIVDETENTSISNEMVKEGLIRDYVNSFIGEVDKQNIIKEVSKELKEILPNLDESTLRNAYLQKGEFIQETKKSLEAQIQQEKRDLKRYLEKEAKKKFTKTEAQRAELQRLKESTKRKIKDFERRLKEGEFEKEEPIILSKKQDAELIKLKKEENEVVSAFRKKQTELQEKNTHWFKRIVDTALSTYVANLIASPTTLAKVGYMSIIRPTSEVVRKQTLGRVFEAIVPSFAKAAEKGGESASLKSLKSSLQAYFNQTTPEKLEKKYQNSIKEYDQAAKKYYDAVAQGIDKKELKKLEKNMNDALLGAYGNVIFQFIGGSSLKDVWQSFINRSNEIEKQFGKVDVESIRDGDALTKINYFIGFIGRSHSALKTLSARFSYAASFMTKLEAARRDGTISDPNKILEIAHESYLDWERGKYQQDNWVTNKWNDISATARKNTSRNVAWKVFDKALETGLKLDVAITRVPVNILHEEVAEYALGAFRAPWLAYKEYAKAKNMAIDEGYSKALDSKEFKEQIKKNIQNMDANQAARIYRLFTKGGLGMGLYALTATLGLMQFGVFPHKGQKKKKEEEYLAPDELNPGQVMFGKTKLGETISKLIEHTPTLWPAFMGLGIGKIYADDVKSGKTTAQAAWDALYTHLEIIQEGIPQTKIISPLELIKSSAKTFLGKLSSTFGLFSDYIDGKGNFIDQEQKKLTITSPEVLRLKDFGVEMPKLSKRDKHKITPDKNHPQVGVDKEGKPYAYMNDLEWNKYVEYRANFINDALDEIYAYEVDAKNAHKQDPENMPDFNLDKPIMQMALDKIIRKANTLAKNRLIDEGYLPEKDKEVDETYRDIEKLLQRLYKENKMGGGEENQQAPIQQPEPEPEFIPMEQIQVPED